MRTAKLGFGATPTAVLVWVAAVMGVIVSAVLSPSAGSQPLPCKIDLDVTRLEAGDLVWPRKAMAMIPYGSAGEDADRRAWERERSAWLKALDGQPLSDAEARDRLRIAQMTFNEFRAEYLEGAGAQPRGFGRLVGHVAIVDVDASGARFIVEALLDKGVVRTPLAAWAGTVCEDVFWHGRVKATVEARREIAAEARRHVGRPYSILNRRLDDESAFYCSKLAWLAIRRATGRPPDGDPTPARFVWFSPRQLLESQIVERLQDPGNYAKPISNPKQ